MDSNVSKKEIYTRAKIVKIMPMDYNAFMVSERRIRILDGKNEPGYRVEYSNGFACWCSKDVFESISREVKETEINLVSMDSVSPASVIPTEELQELIEKLKAKEVSEAILNIVAQGYQNRGSVRSLMPGCGMEDLHQSIVPESRGRSIPVDMQNGSPKSKERLTPLEKGILKLMVEEDLTILKLKKSLWKIMGFLPDHSKLSADSCKDFLESIQDTLENTSTINE